MHRDHVSHWAGPALHVVTGITVAGVIDGYDEWFSRITCLFHTRPGGSYLFAIITSYYHCSIVHLPSSFLM